MTNIIPLQNLSAPFYAKFVSFQQIFLCKIIQLNKLFLNVYKIICLLVD